MHYVNLVLILLLLAEPTLAGRPGDVTGGSCGGCGMGLVDPEPLPFFPAVLLSPDLAETEAELELLEMARIGNAEAFAELLAESPNIIVQDIIFQRNALSQAALQGHQEIVKLILAHAWEHGRLEELLRAVDFEGASALHLAALGGHLEIAHLIVSYILKIGAYDLLTKTNGKGQSPEQVAGAMGFIGEIDFSLQQAISQGKLRGVKSSLAEGADLRIGSFLFGVTPLQAAIQLGHQDIVLALMNHAYAQGNIGVLIAAVDYLGQNVAHYAAASPDPGMYAIVAAALVANGRLDLLQLVSYAGLTPLQAKYGLDRQKAES